MRAVSLIVVALLLLSGCTSRRNAQDGSDRSESGGPLPDLTVTELVVRPDNETGRKYNFTATIQNIGEGPAGPFSAWLRTDETERYVINRTSVPGLAPGESFFYRGEGWRGTLETELRLEADFALAVSESDEGNNVRTVLPPARPYPDLVVEAFEATPTGDDLERYNLSAVIRNEGEIRSGPFRAWFRTNEETAYVLNFSDFSGLDPGESVSYRTRGARGSLETALRVEADIQDTVDESNESNNVLSIPASHPADLSITSITISPDFLSDGRQALIFAPVTNRGRVEISGATVRFFVDGVLVAEEPVPVLAPGYGEYPATTWNATTGNHTILARVGLPPEIEDYRPENDAKERSIEVVPRGARTQGGEAPDLSSTETISRSFAWTYGGRSWTLDLSVGLGLYDYYKGRDRSDFRNDYSLFVSDPWDDGFVSELAAALRSRADGASYNDALRLEFALAFVQAIPYALDSVTSPFDEYPRFPVETLVDEASDCEDTSILYASLVRALSGDAKLLEYSDHMAVGVKNVGFSGSYYEDEGSRFYYAETTGENWRIGEVPSDYDGVSARLLSLEPKARMGNLEWTSKWRGTVLEVSANVTNVGTTTATNSVVWAAFEAGPETVWDQESCDPVDLAPGATASCTLFLVAPPEGTTTRLLVRAWAENARRVDSQSGEFTI